MKRTLFMTLGFIVALAVGGLLLPTLGSQANAGSNCKSFAALGHAVLTSSTPLALTDTWGGPIFIMLQDQFLGLTSVLSGNDGEEIWRQHMGAGKGGSYTVGVNCSAPSAPGGLYFCPDTFTYEVPKAVFPSPPGQAGIMFYMGNTAKIVGGTGKFYGASGNLNVRGPAIAWVDPASSIGFSGRWSPEISGNICGIQ